jgi:hypothetical protein
MIITILLLPLGHIYFNGARSHEGSDPWGACPFFLGSYWYYRGALPLGDGSQGEGNSQLCVVPPKGRVSGQYIVLEASPGPSDLIPWIQGLLGTSRSFMVTPTKAHKSLKSWLGRIDLIWKEFESITSPNFIIPNLLLYPSDIRV